MMDGSMWYADGGGGIFRHVDGPFAEPCRDPVVSHLGFGGLGAGGDVPAEIGIPVPVTASPAKIAELVEKSLAERGLSFSKESQPPPGAGEGWPTWAKVTAGVGAGVLAAGALSLALRRR